MRSEFLTRLDFLPSWAIPSYWFCLTAAIILGCLITLYLWRRSGEHSRVVADLLFWGVLSLLAGARLFHFLQFGFPSSFKGLFTTGGIALYGGLFGLLFAWTVYYSIHRYPVPGFLDCTAPALAMGLSLGRIGCFMAGCDGGLVCDLPWAVRFPPGSSLYVLQIRDGLLTERSLLSHPVHPTQLYESLFGLAAFVGLLYLFKRRQFNGQVFLSGMLWYAVYRFFSEFLRVDVGGLHPFGVFTFSQFVSLLLGSAALLGLLIAQFRRSSVVVRNG